jgi:hypothetical protein
MTGLRRRRLLLVGPVAVALLACGLVVWLTRPTPGVTLETWQRIRRGMTLQEVEALCGRAATPLEPGPGETLSALWDGQQPGTAVHITVNRTGLVEVAVYLEPPGPSPPTFWDRLRRLFRL